MLKRVRAGCACATLNLVWAAVGALFSLGLTGESVDCNSPAVQLLDANTGQFTRPSEGYGPNRAASHLDWFDADEVRRVTIATASPAEGSLRPDLHISKPGEDPNIYYYIQPHCSDGSFLYAVAGRADGSDYFGIWRSADGENWTRIDPNDPNDELKAVSLHYLQFEDPNDNYLLAAVAQYAPSDADDPDNEGYWTYWYRSTVLGDPPQYNWQPCQENGVDFRFPRCYSTIAELCKDARPWRCNSATHGTVLLAEYGAPDVTNLYRSTTDDPNWTRVHHIESNKPDTGAARHFHDACYHDGTERWVLAMGDSGNCRFFFSDADGEPNSWFPLETFGEGWNFLQPTSLLDFDDPNWLLAGSDEGRGVYRLNPATGETRFGWNSGDQRQGCNNFFALAKQPSYGEGVYYAMQYRHAPCAAPTPDNWGEGAAILVSPDADNWTTYYRFAKTEDPCTTVVGAPYFAGLVGDKLWFTVDYVSEPYRTAFWLKPADVSLSTVALLEPGATNLLQHFEGNERIHYADFEANYYWPGDGSIVTKSLSTSSPYQGAHCATYRKTGQATVGYKLYTWANCLNAQALEPGVRLVASVHARGDGGINSEYKVWSDEHWQFTNFERRGQTLAGGWAELRTSPWINNPELRTAYDNAVFMLVVQSRDGDVDTMDRPLLSLDLDAAMLQVIPSTTWCDPNVPREDERLWWEGVKAPSGWYHVIYIWPREPMRYYAGCESLYVMSWIAPKVGMLDRYAVLYFDPNSSSLVLKYTEDSGANWLVSLSAGPLNWNEHYAPLRIVIQTNAESTSLSVDDAGATRTDSTASALALLRCTDITICTGTPGLESQSGQLPCLLGTGYFFDELAHPEIGRKPRK